MRESLQGKRALSARDLGALGVPTRQKDEAIALLVQAGFEACAGGVRVPLLAQLRPLLEQRKMISADPKKLSPLLSGVKATELKPAMRALLSSGEARLVLRGKKQLYLAQPHFRILPAPQVRDLLKQAVALADLCKLALAEKPAAASLFWSDVNEHLEALRLAGAAAEAARDTPARPAPRSGERRLTEAEVLVALREAERPSLGLSFVPEAVSKLEGQGTLPEIHERLLALNQAGAIELRPEAGRGRFSAEELERCPPGPRGFFLVWARLSEPSR